LEFGISFREESRVASVAGNVVGNVCVIEMDARAISSCDARMMRELLRVNGFT
jgi:hypothetical protein